MKAEDLSLGQSDQGVAGPERMVEECEGMIFRQCGQPEGELGQVDGRASAYFYDDCADRTGLRPAN